MSYSVIIPAHNSVRSVAEAVRSARTQRVPPLEVIVVDDASGDDTARVAGEAGARVLRLDENVGAAAARNAGVASAAGERIAFLDADDSWLPDHLERITAAFAAVPDAVVAFGGLIKLRGSIVHEPPSRFPEGHPLQLFGDLLRRNQVPTSAAVVRRDHYLAVGGMDPHLRIAHDYGLWLKLARRGPFVRAEGATVHYVIHADQLTSSYSVLLDESWQVRFAMFDGLSDAEQAVHRPRLLEAWQLELARSWTRRSSAELTLLLGKADRIAGANRHVARWRRRRLALDLLRVPLRLWDATPRGLRTWVARLRGNYEFDGRR